MQTLYWPMMYNPEIKVQKHKQTISEESTRCIRKVNQILTQIIEVHLETLLTGQVKRIGVLNLGGKARTMKKVPIETVKDQMPVLVRVKEVYLETLKTES